MIKDFIIKKYKLLLAILAILILLVGGFIIWYLMPYRVNKNFKDIDLSKTNKLMIVAHPDDDILWGGAHLIEDNYLVVCITCGTNKTRVNEFKQVMSKTNDKYIMLGYPDKTNGERDNWNSSKENMMKDLEEIINLKDWDLIVVHNPDGEYGHQHHKMASQFVTSLVDDKSKLYYFGHYYSKDNIAAHEDEMSSIDGKTLEKKVRIIGLYKSQSFIQTTFDHMFEHEDWLSYYEWMSESNEDA
jgi:LmbE family N-acetylglucosaminyl deacetylase